MPSFISAAVAALSLSSLASANVAYRRQEQGFNSSSSASSQLSTRVPVPIGTGSSSIIGTSSAVSSSVAGGVNPGSNSTATATGGSSATRTGSNPSATASGSTPDSLTINGVTFSLEVNITYSGVEIDLAIQLTKRADETLPQCLTTCAANTECTCCPGVTFATVTGRANNSTSSAAGNGTSSTRGPTFPTSTRTNNGTSVTATPNNPGTNGTFPNAESLICPTYDDEVLLNTDGSQYLIRCGLNIDGTVISVRKARMIRRQATFGNDWIVDCIDTCSALGNCVGTSYNSVQGTCTFYSSVDGLVADANTDSAILVNEAGDVPSATPVVSTVTSTANGVLTTITTTPMTTSTVYSTTTRTIQSCAPGVPCAGAQTVTEIVVAYTTVCPVSAVPTGVATGGAGATITKVCTACAYQPTVVTVYQCPTAPGAPGAGKPTAVATKTISVPVLNGPTGALMTSTVYQTQEHVTTTCGANGCGKATVTAVVSLYTTVCPVSSGASTPAASNPGSSAPAPSSSEAVYVPGTTKPATTETHPASTVPGTTNEATTVQPSTKAATTETKPATTVKASSSIVQYNPSSTTSGVVQYTGAAVKNGMGFAAVVAGVAALVL
ncbi:unnamed protein product [Aureobasidium pullulans]|nr:unnamed protein product [Aureobasidium pullulans]